MNRIFLICYVLLNGAMVSAQGLFFTDFEKPLQRYTEATIRATTVADFNGDSVQDAATCYVNRILLHKQKDSGQFEYPVEIFYDTDSTDYFLDLKTADIDGDLLQDLVLYKRSGVYWMRNEGSFQFAKEKKLVNIQSAIYTLHMLDANEDGKPDFLTTIDYNVTLFLNVRPDSFTRVVIDALSYSGLSNILMTDYNHDGKKDIVGVSEVFSNTYIYVFAGTGNGNFAKATQIYEGKNTHGPGPYLVDVDHDSLLDVIFFDGPSTGTDFGFLKWFEQSAKDSSIEWVLPFYKRIEANNILCLDGDKNEGLNIYYTKPSSKSLFRVILDSLNGFQEGSTVYMPQGNSGGAMFTSDVNFDSLLDLFAYDIKNQGVHWYKNQGSGVFKHQSELTHSMHHVTQFLVEDLDHDNVPDLVYTHDNRATSGHQMNLVVAKEKEGYFENITYKRLDMEYVHKLLASDLDGDTLKDLIGISRYTHKLLLFQNLGKLNFRPEREIYTFTGEVNDLHVVDYDNDGDQDILVSQSNALKLHLFTNDGKSGFNHSLVNIGNVRLSIFDVKDLNGDKTYDFVGVDSNGKRVVTLLSTSTNTYSLTVLYDLSAVGSCQKIQLVDIDGDADYDIITGWSGFTSHDIQLFENTSNGFDSPITLANTVGSVYDFLCDDHDSDGDSDIIYTSHALGDIIIYVLSNRAKNQFSRQEIARSDAVFQISLVSSDLNGDNSKDLVFHKYKRLVWLENISTNPIIRGKHYYDKNANGLRDSAEQTISIGKTKVQPNNVAHYANTRGEYSYYLYPGSYQIAFDTTTIDGWSFTSDSVRRNVTLNKYKAQYEIDYGLIPDSLYNDISLVVPLNTLSCRSRTIPFVYRNTGTTVLNGTAYLQLAREIAENGNLEFHPKPDINQGDSLLGWYIVDLFPTYGIQIRCRVDFGAGVIDIIRLSDRLKASAYAHVSSTTGSDTFIYENKLDFRCAYDPNDKLTQPYRDTLSNPTLRTETLTYTIRFQNTGNDTAESVEIRDTLSPYLDLETFTFIGSSHDDVLTIATHGDRNYSFLFSGIMLPDSGANFDESMGFVSFKVKQTIGSPRGTKIINKASIYFDRNPPIHTPPVLNTIVDSLPDQRTVDPKDSLVKTQKFNVYPNPSYDVFTIRIPDFTGSESIQLYNVAGQLVQRFKPKTAIINYQTSALQSGLYYLSVVRGQQQVGVATILVLAP